MHGFLIDTRAEVGKLAFSLFFLFCVVNQQAFFFKCLINPSRCAEAEVKLILFCRNKRICDNPRRSVPRCWILHKTKPLQFCVERIVDRPINKGRAGSNLAAIVPKGLSHSFIYTIENRSEFTLLFRLSQRAVWRVSDVRDVSRR